MIDLAAGDTSVGSTPLCLRARLAVVNLKVEDYFPLKKRWWLRLSEKGGKVNEMGCHHKLEQYIDEYIAAAGIGGDKKGPLFRTAIGRTGKLSNRSMSRMDAWYMVRRRAKNAGVETAIAIILSGPSVSRTIWNAAATLTSPSGWQVTQTSKRLNSTTGAATK